jgi:hypothetical protein
MLTSAPRLGLSSSCFKAKKVLSGSVLSNIVISKLVTLFNNKLQRFSSAFFGLKGVFVQAGAHFGASLSI